MDEKKVLKVMQVIPDFSLAGAEILTENLCMELKHNSVITSAVSFYTNQTAITHRLVQNHIPIYFLNKSKGFDPTIIFKLYRLFKREKPDVVHSHLYTLPYVVIAALMAKVPVLMHTIHNVAKKEAGKIHRVFNWCCFRIGVVPVAISDSVKQTVMDEYGLSYERIPVIINGINQKKITQKKEYAIDNKEIRLLHIGRFSIQKNHEGLIDSFCMIQNKYPWARLTLVGEGSLEEKIKKKVDQLGLNKHVDFLGTTEDITVLINNPDIFLLPSLWEGMPIVLIEAMSAGLPIVATSVGGVTDMITDGKTGLICKPETELFTQKVLTLIEDKKLREKIGRCAVCESKQFSAAEMVKKYIRLYEKEMRKKD